MSPLQLLAISDRFGGSGYIAGESPGLVTVVTVPAQRHLELRDRLTRTTVLVIFSNPDGSYAFKNLDTARVFDVIGRDWSGTYNDVIVSRITPEPL